MHSPDAKPNKSLRLSPIPLAPKALLRRVMASDNTMVRACDVVFPMISGSKELFLRFARYVDDLPGPLSDSLLADSMRSAITLVGERCGLAPITIETHLRGFGTLCEGLLSHLEHLERLAVRDSSGLTWRASQGSLADWKRTAAPPFELDLLGSLESVPAVFLRLLLLSSIVDFADVVQIGDQWPMLAEA